MPRHETEHAVHAWSLGETLLEWHRYPPGPAGELPPHAHEQYQICLSLDAPGEYRYRRARHPVPTGALSVVHPGEVHAARDPTDRPAPSTYRVAYVPPDLLRAAAAEVAGRAAEPFFASPVLLDRPLAARFLAAHAASEADASRLEGDERLLAFLARFVRSHAGLASAPARGGNERRAVRLVRAYLDAHPAEDVALQGLADLADLSPFHLARVFASEVGQPPHAYQLGVRVSRAKRLLLAGQPPARVAAEAGFYDQSHLARHFKRLVGTSPGRYVRDRKIVQDADR